MAVFRPAASIALGPIGFGLLALYLLWGANYLAVRWAVAGIPPFLMAGSRYFVAGFLVWAVVEGFARARGSALPRVTKRELALGALGGAVFVFCGDGGIAFAEQYIDSSLAALLVATIPLWTALGAWAWGFSGKPNAAVWLALVLGFIGIGSLVDRHAAGNHYLLGVAVMLGLSLIWVIGSFCLKKAEKVKAPPSPARSAALQMIWGGSALLILSATSGEMGNFSTAQVTAKSLGGYGYLCVGDCLIGFPLYLWLLRVCPPGLLSTYAFMCPLVALLLGVTLGRELFTLRLLLGSVAILAAVALLIFFSPSEKKKT